MLEQPDRLAKLAPIRVQKAARHEHVELAERVADCVGDAKSFLRAPGGFFELAEWCKRLQCEMARIDGRKHRHSRTLAHPFTRQRFDRVVVEAHRPAVLT